MPDSLFPDADRQLLLAVDEASNDEGWATASEVRREYDGYHSGAGPWARRLWKHKDMGLLETTGNASRTFWGLTEAGSEFLYAN